MSFVCFTSLLNGHEAGVPVTGCGGFRMYLTPFIRVGLLFVGELHTVQEGGVASTYGSAIKESRRNTES